MVREDKFKVSIFAGGTSSSNMRDTSGHLNFENDFEITRLRQCGGRNASVIGKRPISMFGRGIIRIVVLRCKRSIIIQRRLFARPDLTGYPFSLRLRAVSLPTAELPAELRLVRGGHWVTSRLYCHIFLDIASERASVLGIN